jgi:hypothetical protein
VNQMTEIETKEIETVTVTFDEVKEKVAHYYRLKETKRLVVMRDEDVISVLGPWLPGERRRRMSRYPMPWFELLNEMFPEPWDPDEPSSGQRIFEEIRGYRPRATSIPPRSSS